MKKNNNYISIKTNLITNFKPNILNNKSCLNFTKKKNFNNNSIGNQIKCKNFLIYLLLIKYKNNFLFKKSNIFIKKFKKKVYTILRSPYRHKLARHQICLNRYEINFSTIINVNNYVQICNWKKFINYFNFLKSFNNIFESNIIYTNSINLKFFIKYEKNFDINNFQKQNIIKNK